MGMQKSCNRADVIIRLLSSESKDIAGIEIMPDITVSNRLQDFLF
jgi:hypothetical protein